MTNENPTNDKGMGLEADDAWWLVRANGPRLVFVSVGSVITDPTPATV